MTPRGRSTIAPVSDFSEVATHSRFGEPADSRTGRQSPHFAREKGHHLAGTDAATKPRRSGRLSRLFVAALLLLAACVVIRSLAPQTLGETARRQFLAQLSEHYADLSVSIGRGRYEPDVGLIFEDIRIDQPASATFQFRSQQMVRIARMTVVADLHPKKLLDKKIPMVTQRVVLEGVHANAWLDDAGNVSLNKLYPFPTLGPAAPKLQLRDAKIRLIGGKSHSRPVDFEITDGLLENRSTPTGPQKVLQTGSVDKSISIRGRADFANDIVARCDMTGGEVDLRLAIKDVHFDRDLFERLPAQWSEKIRQARDLDCVGNASISAFRSVGGQWNFKMRTTVHDGRFNHPALPKPLSELRGVVAADPSGLTIEASQAMLGDALVRATGKIGGLGWPAPANLNLIARGLLLDDQLASSIPPSMRAGWDRLQPYGRIDVDANLVHDRSSWQSTATVICKGVDVRYDKFPYPVQQLVGRVEIRDWIASSQSLDGRIGGNRMQCAFRLPIRPGITNEKSFVVATDGPVPIDNTLLGALSPRGSPMTRLESFVRSLRPRGSVHLTSAMLATDAGGRQNRKIDLRIVDGHMRYEKFAYPLYNVEGNIRVENDLVKLVGFRATNANAGLILCDGGYQMPSKAASATTLASATKPAGGDSHLALSFRASNVPMDESLRSSIPAETQHTWDAISPSGVLDELNVIVGQHGSAQPLSLDITAIQHPTHQVTSRSLSIRPPSLPYRLDIIGGSVRFDGSQVIIDSINAKHDASTISADGGCVRSAGGRWELLLNLHSGSRLHPDVELIAALPNQMREAMRRLQLRGPLNLRGKTRLLLSDDAHPEPNIDWNLVLQLEGNRIADVGPVHSLRGEVSVEGSRDELGLRASGEVRIDSMHVADQQLTGIRGPFAIDGDRLRLGGGLLDRSQRPTVANLDQIESENPIRGRVFDGALQLNGEVVLSRASFDVDLAVRGAQVTTLLADFGHSDSDLTGTFSGKTQLQGNLGSADLLKGSGAARVEGANLYQLPLIVQLLNQLRITPTEDVAFTDGEVEFTIFGDTVTFSDMQIWGDLVALHGGGTLNRRRELDLTFNTRVSPQNSFTQILRPLRSKRYTLWTIDVKGPLGSPEIERRALEGVGETLERLFPAMGTNQEEEGPEHGTAGLGSWFR